MNDRLITFAHRLLQQSSEQTVELQRLVDLLHQTQPWSNAASLDAPSVSSMETHLSKIADYQGEQRRLLGDISSLLSAYMKTQAPRTSGLIPATEIPEPASQHESAPDWMDQIVSLGPAPIVDGPALDEWSPEETLHAPFIQNSSDKPSPPFSRPPTVPDRWDSLKIGDFRDSGAPQPISPISTAEPSPPPFRRSESQPLFSQSEGLKSPRDELERAVDELLSSPPAPIGPEMVLPPERFQRTMAELHTSAAITIDGILLSAQTLMAGPTQVQCALMKPLPIGQRVHVFFTLPDGTDISASSSVQSMGEQAASTHIATLKFIDLDTGSQSRLVEFVCEQRGQTY